MRINRIMILTLIAIIGTIFSFYIVDMFIIPVTIGEYIAIEIVISTMHAMYNKVKIQSLNN